MEKDIHEIWYQSMSTVVFGQTTLFHKKERL